MILNQDLNEMKRHELFILRMVRHVAEKLCIRVCPAKVATAQVQTGYHENDTEHARTSSR